RWVRRRRRWWWWIRRWRRRLRRRPARDVHRDMQQLRTRGTRSVPAARRQARVLQRLLRAASPSAALLDAKAEGAEARQAGEKTDRCVEAAKGTSGGPELGSPTMTRNTASVTVKLVGGPLNGKRAGSAGAGVRGRLA